MQRVRWALIVVAAGAMTLDGCLWRDWHEWRLGHAKSAELPLKPVGADALFVQSVLIELPIGDVFLNRELWETAKPAAPFEKRALLLENGLRAAVVGGNVSPRFLELLASDSATVDPHLMTFAGRTQEVVPTNGPLQTCSFPFLGELGGQRSTVALRQANCGWCVRPELRSEGRARLLCEPQIQHGEKQDWLRPNADGTKFTLQGELPLERFAGLNFEATIGPREYLVIGGFADRPETLGGAFFIVEAEGRKRQRLLVLQAGKAGAPVSDEPSMGPKPRGGPSIAAVAGLGRENAGDGAGAQR